MSDITTYTGSNGKTQKLSEIPYTYLGNVIRTIEDGRKPDNPPGLLAALKAEMASRPPPEEAPPPASNPRDEAPVRTGPAPLGDNNGPQFTDFEIRFAEKLAPYTVRAVAIKKRALTLEAVKTPQDHETAVEIAREIAKLDKDVTTFHSTEKAEYKVITDAIDRMCLSRGLKGGLLPLTQHLGRIDGEYLAKLDAERAAREAAIAEAHHKEAQAKLDAAAAAESEGKHTQAEVMVEGAQAHEAVAQRHEQAAAAPVGTYGRTSSAVGSAGLKVKAEIESVDRDSLDIEALRHYLSDDAVEKAIKAMIKTRKWADEDILSGAKSIKGVKFYKTNTANFRG